MAQLIPLPLIVSCFGKIEIGLPFWYRLTQVVLDKGLLNGCVCMCVYSSSLFTVLMQHSDISLSLTKLHQNCVDICSSFSSAYWLTKCTGSRTAGTRHTLAALVLPPGNREMEGWMDRCLTTFHYGSCQHKNQKRVHIQNLINPDISTIAPQNNANVFILQKFHENRTTAFRKTNSE